MHAGKLNTFTLTVVLIHAYFLAYIHEIPRVQSAIYGTGSSLTNSTPISGLFDASARTSHTNS